MPERVGQRGTNSPDDTEISLGQILAPSEVLLNTELFVCEADFISADCVTLIGTAITHSPRTYDFVRSQPKESEKPLRGTLWISADLFIAYMQEIGIWHLASELPDTTVDLDPIVRRACYRPFT